MISRALLYQLPSADVLEKQRFTRLLLLWVLSFVAVVRSFALIQFLLSLDYSEVNSVRLTQFIFVQSIFICFLIYFLTLLWRRPHRQALWTLFGLCAVSLYRQQDLVSMLCAVTVGGLGVHLYRSLYRLSPASEDSGQQQLPLEL